MSGQDDPRRLRVLALLSTQRDAELSVDLLGRNGIDVEVCADGAALGEQLALGAGAVLMAEEMLRPDDPRAAQVLEAALRSQPRWSDLPVLLLTHSGADSLVVLQAIEQLGNVTLLERPLRVATLLSALRAALRARSRQYQLQMHLQALEDARLLEVEAGRQKDQFLAMLGHELRNPLAPIRNALLVLDADDSDPARRKQLRGMMLRQVDHLVRLVDDLVEVSRMSQGKISLRCQPLDLRTSVRDAIELVQPLIDAGGHRLEVALPGAPVVVEGDPVRMAQIFGNLINNAAKYGRPGGHIRIALEPGDEQVVVTVADDGQGIEPDLLPRVFEPFTQGPRQTHRLHDGLGIGLALVRGLVQLHHGEVSCSSAGRDLGSVFRVRLPRLPASEAHVPAAPPAPARAEGLRVLVVDDNRDAATSMALLLDVMGLDNRVAFDGASALDVAGTFQPDVALLDIGMPGMDGYAVARELRADPRHRNLVIVALTGWGGEADRQRTRDAGFDEHLSKPVDVHALRALLHEMQGRRRAAA